MNFVVTCGPSYEPIDQARRLTNFSTGRLGIFLSNTWGARGARVTCLKGEGATCPDPLLGVVVPTAFSTNQDLLDRLTALPDRDGFQAVFHAAALCDFRVSRVENEAGPMAASAKFSTRDGALRLVLEPTIKVLPRLPGLFPGARVIGWKYELNGGPAAAFAAAERQLTETGIAACVLNGAAHGPGFTVCTGDGRRLPCTTPAELADALWNFVQG